MMDITLFGALLGTLASALALALLALALGAAAYLAITGIEAARRLPYRPPGGEPAARALGLAAGALSLLLAALGLRIGPGTGAFLATALIALSASWAIGAAAACTYTFAGAGVVAFAAGRARNIELLRQADESRRRGLLTARQSWLQGEDLRAELTRADAAVADLRRALTSLETTHTALETRLTAPDPADPDLIDETLRARDEAALRLDLARRVLEAAEAATFRLACHAPLRVLLRRRPRASTDALAAGLTSDPALRAATTSMEAFLGDVRHARTLLDSLEPRRPSSLPAADPDTDPLTRARRDVDAMETSYRALLDRLGVAQLRLDARAGSEAIEAAAGALTAATAPAPDAVEISALIGEIARAETAIAHAAPEGGAPRALAEALAAGSSALDRSDTASLSELIAALREIR